MEFPIDAIFEIGLRIPADQPSTLASASSVSSTWRGVLTDPLFRTTYIERHRPPIVGQICKDPMNIHKEVKFAPLIKVPYFKPPDCGPGRWFVLDSRSGLVLLYLSDTKDDKLVVWDPITGHHLIVPVPPSPCQYFAAAVVSEGDNWDQFCGSFEIIFAGTDDVDADEYDADVEGDHVNWVHTYSSETGKWSAVSCLKTSPGVQQPLVSMDPPVVLDGYAYFTFEDMQGILKYDRESIRISTLSLPLEVEEQEEEGRIVAVGGKLAYVLLIEDTLHIYTIGDGSVEWQLVTEIRFPNIPPNDWFRSIQGSADNILTKLGNSICKLNIETEKTENLGESVPGCYLPYQRYIIPGEVSPKGSHFLHLSQGAVCKTEMGSTATMFVEVDGQIQCQSKETKIGSEEEFEEKELYQAKSDASIADNLEGHSDDFADVDDSCYNESDDDEEETKNKKRATKSVLKTPSGKKAKTATSSEEKSIQKRVEDTL